MLGRTHQIGGLTAGIAVGTYVLRLPFEPGMVTIIFTLLGSAVIGGMFPDIDHPSSMIGRSFRPVSRMVSKTLGHRGMTHTLLFNLAIPTLAYLIANVMIPPNWHEISNTAIIGFTAGYASHLFLDSLTPQGIPLFAPFSRRDIRLARFRTGKFDYFFQVLLFSLSCYMVYYGYIK